MLFGFLNEFYFFRGARKLQLKMIVTREIEKRENLLKLSLFTRASNKMKR
jgi:hypothetical protein